ncbi:uncharacterized protein LOC132197294 isoform X2 [Neocloeon triangulifer]|uniref:uncharacterized protein LOC132197294 isoform X2 n=1 Tax=Neocloeon triangulifer TaxID=2078957 RepID=UPI00286F0E21|nr:uncharacterized protein LOC132197294 isoform X2 [Neocloeon triangulifer]
MRIMHLEKLLFCIWLGVWSGWFAVAQLSPSSVVECPPKYSKSLFRRHDMCVIKGQHSHQDARISAYVYKCMDPRNETLFEYRNILRVITNGDSFKGRFNMYIFTEDDELQNYYSCIAFDRSEGLFVANFTTLLPSDFYLEVNFEQTAGYCHPDVI